ncbi:MAG: FAD:protein FMN transferase [Prolixibacteraceae bacterium]|jgi:thiamine biosynthesis lipoprotein|nr:FAD:protein FMN transferase [Prolixibacteraceae bacterium]
MYKVSVLSFLLIIIFSACNNPKPVAKFNFNEGGIFGTYYHVAYEHPEGTNLVVEINAELKRLDMSLSTYKTESILSKVNTNRAVELDDLFINVFNKSQEISKITNGAFDPTVAPLVNAWGFGFRKKELVTPELLSSIENYVGYTKVALRNGKIIKKDPRVMLDFSAIAKGYAVDVIGNLLVQNGCSNYMVEIGGEVVAHGVNKEGRTWRIGINEPNDNEPMVPSQLQAIVSLENKALATSGNYRNFYIENGKKFAHTINPKTGYPVEHSLLSATVLADN